MKRPPSKHSRAAVLVPIVTALFVCALPFILAEMPSWWRDRGVVKTDASGQPAAASDFAAANQGQLKEFAVSTYEEFLARIPAELDRIGPSVPPPNPGQPESPANRASPGWRIRHLVTQWVVLNADGTVQRGTDGKRILASGAASQKDFAAINLGQIKAVAAPFYDRLAELYWSYNSGTPATSQIDPAWAKLWTDAPGDANDHVMATLGQLKNTFAIRLDSDGDGDGLTNLAELLANKARGSTPDKWTDLGNAYTTGGGLTDGEQVALGLDPTDPISSAPPDAPTGLHITFRDATAHPLDPDLSKINVEWDVPTGVVSAISLSETYAGSSGGWNPVILADNTKSSDITVPFSKRIYQYRVTFQAPNGLTASTDIAYELPVIRGTMQRTKDTAFTFPGHVLYADHTLTGIPRKFRTATLTWSLEAVTDVGVIDEYHYTGQLYQTTSLETGTRSINNWVHRYGTVTQVSGEMQDYDEKEHFKLDATIPTPLAPSGIISGIISSEEPYTHNVTGDFYHGVEKLLHTHHELDLSLARFPAMDAVGNALPSKPYGAISGSYNLWNLTSAGTTTTDIGTVSREEDAGRQYPIRDGTQTKTVGDGEPEAFPYHRDWGCSPGFPSGNWSGISGDFSICHVLDHRGLNAEHMNPVDVPEGTVITTDIQPTSWSLSYTYDDTQGTTKTWEETASLTDETTTQEMVAAAVASFVDFDTPGVEWFRPYSTASQYEFTNKGLLFDFPWLELFHEWDYTASYTSGAADADLSDGGSAGLPVDGYVTVPPNISGLVGQYSLAANEASGRLISSEYKFRIYPPAETYEIVWEETFTPSDPALVPQYRVRTLNVSPSQTETSVQSVDRTEGFLGLSDQQTVASGAPSPDAQPAPPQGTKVQGDVRLEARIERDLMLRVNRGHSGEINDKSDEALAKYPMGLIVDVNNIPVGVAHVPRNTDATLTFPEKNGDFGYAKDQRVEPLLVNLPIGIPADVKLRVRNPDSPTAMAEPNDFTVGNGRIRLFTGDNTPAQAIPPTGSLYTLIDADKKALGRFWIEGTEAGEVIIDLEYTFTAIGGPKTKVKRVRFEVNVDNPPKDPEKKQSNLESRNRVRAIKEYPRVTGVRSSFAASTEPLLTWHPKPRSEASASMWIGIETNKFPVQVPDPANPGKTIPVDSMAWAQAGLVARSVRGGGQMQQGAKPYAEVAVDWGRYKMTGKRELYRILGALQYKSDARDRKWWNQPYLIMYQKGSSPGHDKIIVQTTGYGTGDRPGADESLLVVEDISSGIILSDKIFAKVQLSFEANQSVSRVPGLPNKPAKFNDVQICVAENALPSAFKQIELLDDNLEIIAVKNDGKELKRDRNFSHYRIQLQSPYDVELWDKYKWRTPDNTLVTDTNPKPSPGQAANRGESW